MAIPGEGSITLDRKAFKALASETRVDILKRLDGTQLTVSDLAREMEMNKATMFEHLEQLVEVGLVRKDTEEDRATTVKTVGSEAPVQGPPKKWVYYRLTWKGKNVLHPERVKIAIMLSSVALVLAIAALLYIALLSSTPGPSPSVSDTSPPLVIGWDTDAVRPGSAVEVSITASDNQSGKVSGLDTGRCLVQWGVAASSGSVVPDALNWSRLQFQVTMGMGTTTLSASVPARDWTPYNGSYLLIGVQLFDKAGNNASFYHSVPIRTASLPELRFVPGSLNVTLSGTETYRTVIITAAVENVGAVNSSPAQVGLYQQDPDPQHAGHTALMPLAVTETGAVPSGGRETIHLQLSSKSLRRGSVYLMLDPEGSLSETDKSDNVASVVLPPGAVPDSHSVASQPGFELVVTTVAVAAGAILVRRLRNLRG